MGEGGSAYLLVEVGQDIGRMESDEGVTNDCRHLVDAAGVGPVRIVDRSESYSLSLEEPVNITPYTKRLTVSPGIPRQSTSYGSHPSYG